MKTIVRPWSILLVAAITLLACGPELPSLVKLDSAPTVRPTRTARPTLATPDTETPVPTATSTATLVLLPSATPRPPTNTPQPAAPSSTPTARPPTNTPLPRPPTNTPLPPATPVPAADFTGTFADVPEAHSCKLTTPFIALRVVDRAGAPLPGYVVHVGQDGDFSKWTLPTNNSFKDAGKPWAYNADFLVAFSVKYYVTVFRRPEDPFNLANAISNQVSIYFPPRDEDNCGTTGMASGIRVAPVTFVYNR